MDQINQHIPVLLNPIVEFYLKHNKGSIVFDGTFGGGGYSQKFLELKSKVYACDLDTNAINRAVTNHDLTLVNQNFGEYINEFSDNYFDMIVVDLGFSNNQLLLDEFGFSYLKDSQPLDLRFDVKRGKSCSDYLNSVNVDDLTKTIFNNSGEHLSRKIALKITDNVNGKDITVGDLKGWVMQAIPAKFMKSKNSILARVWQALRIEINQEFQWLNKFLDLAPSKLKAGGILCVVNFHSLEDKITTKKFRDLSKTREIDNYGNKAQDFILLTKKPITPDQDELDSNPQSRSATLRIIQKCLEQN
jgi:16S rRNA (cytosine1402-N4)-methyltransferase